MEMFCAKLIFIASKKHAAEFIIINFLSKKVFRMCVSVCV